MGLVAGDVFWNSRIPPENLGPTWGQSLLRQEFHAGPALESGKAASDPDPKPATWPFGMGGSQVLIWVWLVLWNTATFSFSIQVGISSSQLTNSYFSEGFFNHQPEYTFIIPIISYIIPSYPHCNEIPTLNPNFWGHWNRCACFLIYPEAQPWSPQKDGELSHDGHFTRQNPLFEVPIFDPFYDMSGPQRDFGSCCR